MAEQPSVETIANFSRRAFLAAAAAGTGGLALAQSASSAYGNGTLPAGIRSRQIANVNGTLTVHILEAGYETPAVYVTVLFLHGFPELAYSWRKVMPSLAAGKPYHVIAPDQRGWRSAPAAGTIPTTPIRIRSAFST